MKDEIIKTTSQCDSRFAAKASTFTLKKKDPKGTTTKNEQLYIINTGDGIKSDFYCHLFIFFF